MNYTMVMSLSGCSMYILYLIVRRCFKARIQEQIYSCLLKMSIFYFLIPLPFLKEIYTQLYYALKGKINEKLALYYKQEDMLIFVKESKIFLNEAFKINILFIGVWILGTISVCMYFISIYLKRRKVLINCNIVEMTEVENLFESLRKEYKVKANVKIKICDMSISPFTIGFIKPIIFCSDEATKEEYQMLFSHELVHIKKRDLLWKFACLVVVNAHWFNPIAWLLKKEMDKVCEYTCDEEVVHEKDEQYCKKYAKLLITTAIKKRKGKS